VKPRERLNLAGAIGVYGVFESTLNSSTEYYPSRQLGQCLVAGWIPAWKGVFRSISRLGRAKGFLKSYSVAY